MKPDGLKQFDCENFSLSNDLKQLKKVIDSNAIEAIVFYSGRILEATSNYCVDILGEKSNNNVFSNIEHINDYNLLDLVTRHWAHGLRRLANQFRHILKPTEINDGVIAVILLNSWLDWLINKSQLVNNNQEHFTLHSHEKSEINTQLQWINEWLTHKDFHELANKEDSIILEQPIFSAVICEELINKKEFTAATNYLQTSLKGHPNDLRLLQLQGLLLSRTDQLKKAEQILRSLLKKFPNDDETIGILAGVYKKMWQMGDESKLPTWGKLYKKGWLQSKERNTYLGINAAAYALWIGEKENSKEIATNIVHQYEKRQKILMDTLKLPTNKMDYWDQATLAEAQLLAHEIEQAESYYHDLFTAKHYINQPHEIAAKQLAHHLSFLDDQKYSNLLTLAEKQMTN
jgi:hypothetical protein